jgi:GAF domain-containing protein
MDPTTRLQAFLELTEAVSRARSVDAVYDAAIACVERSLGVSRAALLLFDDDGVLRFKAWRGVSDAQRAEIEGRSPWAAGAREAEAFVVADVFADPRY